jgi:predicted PurR-regulated permease PerM
VVPRLSSEVASLTQKIPDVSAQIASGEIVGNVLNKPGWADQRVGQIEQMVRSHAGQILGYVQKAATAGLKWLAGAWVVVLIPIFAFFILKDAEVFVGAISALIEDRPHRQLWRAIASDVHVLLGEYVRALVLLSLVTFGVWSVLFFVFGVPYAMVLAAIGGVLEFIPLVGPLTAGIVVVSTAIFAGFAHPWLLAGFILAWRLVQDYGTSPLLMGRGVEMHPALVIFGVIAGGEIAGPAGMFLSVPVMAAVRVVFRRVQDFHAARQLLRPPGTPSA